MAADDLFFLRTGTETGPYVLVTLGSHEPIDAKAHLENADAGGTREGLDLSGDLPDVLREANEFALLNGYDMRIELNGRTWPEHLGVIGNT
jgi:hypothetical protein